MGAASHRPHARSFRPKATQAIGPNPVPTCRNLTTRCRYSLTQTIVPSPWLDLAPSGLRANPLVGTLNPLVNTIHCTCYLDRWHLRQLEAVARRFVGYHI